VTADGPASLVKCVVWDLDATLWDGTLLEDRTVTVRPAMLEVVRRLDRRGILNAVASHNDEALAMAALERAGVAELFLEPRIGWAAKPAMVREIASALNLGLDSFAFVDDDPFQRDQVRFALPAVRCYDPEEMVAAVGSAPFNGPTSPESPLKRALYQTEARRRRDEEAFAGTPTEFLGGLGMVLTIGRAREADLSRAEELTVRTRQLNTTGVAYSRNELAALTRSPEGMVMMAELTDRYGTYGKIGLAIVERSVAHWTLKLFLVSCRVLSRGVAAVFLHQLVELARRAGADFRAELVPNGRNRLMLVTLRFAGFEQVWERDGRLVLESRRAVEAPAHMTVRMDADA
jgi:FkbH-like protein